MRARNGITRGSVLPQSSTLIISSASPAWHNLTKLTWATQKKWADKHGYDFYADVSDLQDNYFDRATNSMKRVGIHGFVKLDLFLYWLPKYKRVIWLDADMVITNYDAFTADNIMWGADVREITMPFDFNGHNATVISAWSSDLTYDFFWAANNSGRKMFLNHDWYEMEAMRYFAMTPPYNALLGYMSVKRLCPILHKEYVPYVPERVSAKYGWEKGDWSCHLSAFHIEKRVELAQRLVTENSLL